ncbi:MAG: hypothetical protein JWO05_1063 [Gemmatimonadetes bacterium]|nr:hypothetical protein [Gemmatimonadota bacterium]
MKRLFVPTLGPSDWRRLLADPDKHWKANYSAYESAVAWEAARSTPRGLPYEIAQVLDSHPRFRNCSLVFGVPEHRVALEGGGHASQTDLWALLSTAAGLVSTSIEAKAGESFDTTVEEWLSKAKVGSGKPDRLRALCKLWNVSEDKISGCRYQLMHRPATAILEAKRFHANTALFLVHAFERMPEINRSSHDDYSIWRRALGIDASHAGLQCAGTFDGIELWMAWVSAPTADERTVRAAV